MKAALIIIACIFFIAFLVISLVLMNKKVDATAKERLAKKVYKASLWVMIVSMAISVIVLVLVILFREVEPLVWFFDKVVNCIFAAGFLTIPVGQCAARYISDEKPKEREG